MLRVIREETQHPSHHGYGMFVLIIMTHGTDRELYGSDGRAVKVSDIYDLLSAGNFGAMAGKPKMVIIQACAGGNNFFVLSQ